MCFAIENFENFLCWLRIKSVDKSMLNNVYYHCCISHMCAVVAQSVERRLGKAEVGGSIPLDSF